MKIIEIEDKIKSITGTDIDGCDKWLDDSLKKEEVTKLLLKKYLGNKNYSHFCECKSFD